MVSILALRHTVKKETLKKLKISDFLLLAIRLRSHLSSLTILVEYFADILEAGDYK